MRELNPDHVASWYMLQLAEQGRPVEQCAQFLASYIVSGDLDTSTSFSFLSAVLARTDELLNEQILIWDGLLPGAITSNDTHDYLSHRLDDEPSQTPKNPSDFDYRMKDIQVDRIRMIGNGMWQLEGYDLDGKHVWIQLIGDLAIQQP